MKGERIQRIIRLIVRLQSSRCSTADELAAEFEVSRRSVFRDLRVLELAGIPFYYDRASGGYRILSTFFLRPVSLDLEEALSLLLLTEGAGGRGGIPHLSAAWRAANKIESALPGEMRRELGPLTQRMRVAVGRTAVAPDGRGVFEACRAAVAASRKVRLLYRSLYEGERIRTTLAPYALFFGERAWYAIGASSLHHSVRMFKLDRIAELAPTEEAFRVPRGFSVEKFLGQAWHLIRGPRRYQVVVRFLPKVATNVSEVRWHRTQVLAWQTDGSLIFSVTVDGIDEIAWWVLGYGPYAEVLRPAVLRAKVAELARQTAQKYEER
jgi:predicted DNA-binding transcriptional regulator YafY